MEKAPINPVEKVYRGSTNSVAFTINREIFNHSLKINSIISDDTSLDVLESINIICPVWLD